ncbi:lipocalin-like domain-containing protein [Rheinheimera sp. F8]|uniref:lipocalin-like domain-containing protein n=1 Tax=Rheinheimera sp. F8 TaxID=1763998 RepID=UPI000B246D93|nr:lipocalin-like domain-containing protein [Rheinheimera sp. F8]
MFTKFAIIKSSTAKSVLSRILAVTALTTIIASAGAMAAPEPHPLVGSWQMDSAWETLADGRRVTTYTEHPDGLLLIDANGRYSLQIFHPKRKKFAGSKASASAEEFKDAVIGSSTHFGTISLDPTAQQLVFHIEAASYPNWNHTTQVRDFTLKNNVLSYAVPAAASGNGTIAYSVWRRLP